MVHSNDVQKLLGCLKPGTAFRKTPLFEKLAWFVLLALCFSLLLAGAPYLNSEDTLPHEVSATVTAADGGSPTSDRIYVGINSLHNSYAALSVNVATPGSYDPEIGHYVATVEWVDKKGRSGEPGGLGNMSGERLGKTFPNDGARHNWQLLLSYPADASPYSSLRFKIYGLKNELGSVSSAIGANAVLEQSAWSGKSAIVIDVGPAPKRRALAPALTPANTSISQLAQTVRQGPLWKMADATTPTLSVTALSTFTYQIGDPPPAAQTLGITSSDTQVSFSATTIYGWLNLRPTAGITPGQVTVSANPVGLGAGSYNGTITVNSQNALNTPIQVPVQLVITGTGGTVGLTLNCTPSSGPVTVSVPYTATCTASGGTAPYQFAISSGSLPSGIVFKPSQTTASISGTPTIAGPYSYTVTVTDSSTQPQSANQAYSGSISSLPSGPPLLSSLSPSSATAGTVSFTLGLTGSNFVNGSAVHWNATTLATTFVSTTQLTASVPASLISDVGNASVTIVNPGPAVSNPLNFAINPPTSCTPSAVLLQPISPLAGFSAALGQPVNIGISASDNCGGSTAAATAVFSNGDPETQLTSIGKGNYAGTWVPTNSAPSGVVITVTAFESITSGKFLAGQTAVSGTVQTAQAPQLAASLSNLAFSLTQAGTPAGQSLTISNEGGGTANFTAIASGGPWLSVSPASGVVSPGAPTALTVTADPTSLSSGTYTGAITVQSGSQTVSVRVSVTVSPPQGILVLSQVALSFTIAEAGGAPLPQDFAILNIGQGSMNWSASASSTNGWLSLSSSSGTVVRPYLDASTVNASVNPANLTAGTYYGQIQVTSNDVANSPLSISVVLTVLPRGSNPGPEVRPSGLIFVGSQNILEAAQTVMISNPGAQLTQFNSGLITPVGVGTWFVNTPSNTSITPGQPAQMSVQPDFSLLSPGATRGEIALLFSDGTMRQISLLAVVPPPSTTAAIAGAKPHASGCIPAQLNIQPSGSQQVLTASVGQPVTIDVRVVDSCGQPLTNASPSSSVGVAFSNGDKPGQLTHVGNGRWTTTWQPQHPVPSGTPAVATVTAFSALTNGQVLANQLDIPVTFGAPSAVPTVISGAVLNAASFAPSSPVAPGSLVTIFGANLANGATGQSSTAPLPVQLGQTQVMLGGRALPLLFTSDGQINAQLPNDLPVDIPSQLVVQAAGALSVPQAIQIAPAQPAIFTQLQSGSGQGIIVNYATNLLADSNAPVTAGDTVIISCTGLGAVTPSVPLGSAATGPTPTVAPVTATIGGQQATVLYAGLTPGYPGLYQVNAVVPSGTGAGNQIPVVLSTAGQNSPPVTIAVK